MSLVMIPYPITGQAVSTEIETEASIFHTLPQVESWIVCPVCGQEHVWTRRDAWLTDAPGQRRAGTPEGGVTPLP